MSAIFGIYNFKKSGAVTKCELQNMAKSMEHRGRGPADFFLDRFIGLGRLGSSIAPITPQSATYSKTRFFMDGRLHAEQAAGEKLDQDQTARSARALAGSLADFCWEFLDGQFAIAAWDGDNQLLALVRDRFGAKPLYYCQSGDQIIFASEIKAIIAALDEQPSPDLSLLEEYLAFRSVYGENTLFKGIKEVLPGTCITWNGTRKNVKEFWSPEKAMSASTQTAPEPHAEQVEKLLRESIRKNIGSAKKIGANCSGGIDSGLVTAFTTLLSKDRIKSFTLAFREKEWDERYYAGFIARKYGTDHHEIETCAENFANDLPSLNYYNDEPLSDPNSVLVYRLAKYSHSSIDLLLTGEGADEVFLGYPRYNLINVYSIARSLPFSSGHLGAVALRVMPTRRIRKLTEIMKQSPENAIIFNSAFVRRSVIGRLLTPDLRSSSFSFRHSTIASLGHDDLLLKQMIYDIRTYLLSSLKRLDKMNMACGLQTATPFLSNELFDYALAIPRHAKITFWRNKTILRAIASKYLPRENLHMPKSGFGVPIALWFRKDKTLQQFLYAAASDEFMRKIFLSDVVDALISSHLKGHSDNSEILWLITNFYLWYRQYFSQENNMKRQPALNETSFQR